MNQDVSLRSTCTRSTSVADSDYDEFCDQKSTMATNDGTRNTVRDDNHQDCEVGIALDCITHDSNDNSDEVAIGELNENPWDVSLKKHKEFKVGMKETMKGGNANNNTNDEKDTKPRQQSQSEGKKMVSFDTKSPRVYVDRYDKQDRFFLCYRKWEYKSFERDIHLNLYKLIRSKRVGRHPWNLDPNKFCTRGLEKQIAEKGRVRLSFSACKMLLVKRSYWTFPVREKILEQLTELQQKQKVTRNVLRRSSSFSDLFSSSFRKGFEDEYKVLAPEEQMRSVSMALSRTDRILARQRALRDHAETISAGGDNDALVSQVSRSIRESFSMGSSSRSFKQEDNESFRRTMWTSLRGDANPMKGRLLAPHAA